MASLLGTIAGAKSTHENPVRVFWDLHPQQVEFHLRRFRLLTAYFPVVADCSVWWINLMETVTQALPTTRAIGVYRETEACIRSFKGVIVPNYNPWVIPHNGIWHSYFGDPLYPHYELPENARKPSRNECPNGCYSSVRRNSASPQRCARYPNSSVSALPKPR